MVRNLKALGLALVAVFAMSAMAAAGAQAQTPHLVAGAHGTVTGEEHNGIHEFTILANGRALRCTEVHFGGASATTQTSLTISEVTYDGCSTTPVLGISFPVTVTMNGCDYVFNDLAHTSPDYTANVDIECPDDAAIVIHLYSNAAHTNNVCTTTVPEQTNLSGNTITNDASGEFDDLTVHHNVVVNTVGHGGFPCGTGNQAAEYTGTTTLEAFDTEDLQVDLTAATG